MRLSLLSPTITTTTLTNKGIYIAASFLAVLLFQEVPVAQCLVSSSTSPPAPRIRALQQVSSEPLAFIIDDFCDAATCAGLEQNLQEARLHFATLIAGELFAGQWGKHDGLRYNLSQSSDANNNYNSNNNSNSPEIEISGQCAEGLHVDTNNGTPFRSVTAILYLNDLPPECGAATVFPLAGATSTDARLLASKRLLKDGICHTRGSAYHLAKDDDNNDGDNEDGGNDNALLTPLQEADAALLESVASTSANGQGLRIQPQAGRLLLFFSRMDDGSIDPRSWHGGERLVPLESTATTTATTADTATVIGKKIMTLFKEVSYGTTPDHPLSFDGNDYFEKYLSHQVAEQRRSLRALAEAHAPFFAQ